MKILVDVQKPCLETWAYNQLSELGMAIHSIPLQVTPYLSLFLDSLDYLVTYGGKGLDERLLASGSLADINSIASALRKSDALIAHKNAKLIQSKPTQFIPQVVRHYPLVEHQPESVVWSDTSMGRLGIEKPGFGLRSLDAETNERFTAVMSLLAQRISRYNSANGFTH